MMYGWGLMMDECTFVIRRKHEVIYAITYYVFMLHCTYLVCLFVNLSVKRSIGSPNIPDNFFLLPQISYIVYIFILPVRFLLLDGFSHPLFTFHLFCLLGCGGIMIVGLNLDLHSISNSQWNIQLIVPKSLINGKRFARTNHILGRRYTRTTAGNHR